MSTPTPPKYDAGYPEKSHKLCAEKISDGVWCAEDPGHPGPHKGPAARPLAHTSIVGHYAQGTPKK